MQTAVIVIVDNIISKQFTIKKERQETRNKTIQWQTMSKDKKIQMLQ